MKKSSMNIAIGALFILSVLLVVRFLLFLNPQPGDGKFQVRVRFQNIDKISKGTKVTFAGKPIGEVTQITTIDESRIQGESIDGIYPYELLLSLDSATRIYNCDEFSVKTSGLMGEKCIAITPQPPRNGQARLLDTNELVYASLGPSVDEAFTTINQVTKKAEMTLDTLMNVIQQNQSTIAGTLSSVEKASLQLEQLITKMNQTDIAGNTNIAVSKLNGVLSSIENIVQQAAEKKVVDEVAAVAQNINQVILRMDYSEKINSLLQTLKETVDGVHGMCNNLQASWPMVETSLTAVANTALTFSKSAATIEQTTNALDTVVSTIAEGKGSLGRFIFDDEFYFKTMRLMNRSDLLLSDINNYGMLFHLDRSWQRVRRARFEEALQLKTPREVKQYLDEEIKAVFIAFNRLDQALMRAEELSTSANSLQDPRVRQAFSEAFKDLNRDLKDLDDKLKMVGSQVGANH